MEMPLLAGSRILLPSIGPSPSPPVYRPEWPHFWAAWLHALSSWFNSSRAGFSMLRTRNHLLRSKFDTHLRLWKTQEKVRTAALRKHCSTVPRKGSLSCVLTCSVLDSDICKGSGAPKSEWREGIMSGIGSFFARVAFCSSR